jgi:tetratricopeptide (TPR) repeat protein
MPIFDHNPSKDDLRAASDLPVDKFEEGVSQLLTLSLINEESRINDQGVNEIKYEILPLTLSFAQYKLSEDRGFEVEARKRLGKYLERQEKQKEALEQYGYALERIGATTEKGKLAALQAQLAFAAYQRGNYPEAVKLFKQSIDVDSRLAYTYQLWAMVERQEGNIGKAEELFREASILNPNNPIIWRSWAMMKKELNDFDGSEKLLQKGLHYQNNDFATTHSLAVLLSMKGNYTEADKLFKSIFIRSPETFGERRNNMYVYAARAENLRKWGENEEKNSLTIAENKYREAWQLISTGLHFEPTDWTLLKTRIRLYANLARIADKKDNYKNAEEFFKRAIFYNARDESQRRHNSVIYYERAENFQKMEKINEALQMCDLSAQNWHNEDAIDLKNRLLLSKNQ